MTTINAAARPADVSATAQPAADQLSVTVEICAMLPLEKCAV